MATVQQVIDRNRHLDNYSDSIKYRWLGELDGKKYKYPEDVDTELVIKDDTIYDKYLIAMHYFFSGDLMMYSISSEEFYKAFAEV